MPVQINELVIRANVIEGDEKKKESNAPAAGSNEGQQGKDEIIKECVAIVMELLNNKTQR